jgi:hypothetical protein
MVRWESFIACLISKAASNMSDTRVLAKVRAEQEGKMKDYPS